MHLCKFSSSTKVLFIDVSSDLGDEHSCCRVGRKSARAASRGRPTARAAFSLQARPPHRGCPPESRRRPGGRPPARRCLPDRSRCVHALVACLTGGSRRIRSGPKRACATGSTRDGAERIGTVTTARRRDGDRGPVPNAGWIAGWAGLAGLGAQPFGSSSPTRGVGLLRPPSLLSFPHPHRRPWPLTVSSC